VFEFFADDINHFILILSSLLIAILSQIKIVKDTKNQSFRGIQVMMQKQLIFAGSLLLASLFIENIISEILVICGALTILSMHVKKLLSSY
jgi:phosphatidylserine synthase